MRRLVTALLGMILGSGSALADSPQPTHARLWTAAQFASLDKTLTSEMRGTGVAYTYVIHGKTYGALLLHREVTGEAELHVKLNDFFVILGGEAGIKVGGRVIGAKVITADEKLGRTLVGGTVYDVKRGDVLFVPANHWLQVIVARGEVLSAVVIKAQ